MSGFAEGTPTVEIRLGGQSYTLGWTWGAKRRLKEKLEEQGKSLKDEDAITENLPAVLWASMDEDTRAALSIPAVEELINPSNEVMVVEKIGSLFTKSEPDPEVKPEPAAATMPTAGTNSNASGRLLATT